MVVGEGALPVGTMGSLSPSRRDHRLFVSVRNHLIVLRRPPSPLMEELRVLTLGLNQMTVAL
jgi:hypothetical protein